MSNLTTDDVNNRLNATRNEMQLEDLRLWQGLADEKVARVAGDKANKDLIDNNQDSIEDTNRRLSTEVIHREEGDLRNITSITELANALADYRIKTDLELTNERIAREQLGIDLNNKVDTYTATFDHKFFLVHQAIQGFQDETNGKLTLFDERIKKYEQMLQDITTDSIQITMDNGEINMGVWTILSQAREWDLEILGKFKDYQTQTNKDIDDALKEIQDKLPIEQDIIDKAIDQLSNAQIIKDLDAKIDGNISDIDQLHKDLLKETSDRQNEMIDYSQTIANQMKNNQDALVAAVQAESDARIDALQRESAIRQQELVNEAAERTAEITERIKDIEAGTGADLTEVNKRIDDANFYIETVKEGLDTERDERLADIATLNDGLTKEIQSRKDGDKSITTSLENYKASNDVAMANFREEITVVTESNKATVIKVDALDAQVKTMNTELQQTTTVAGSALDKANLALTETSALAQRVSTTEANITQINKDVATKANASTVQLLESRVETIDGEVKASTKAITKLNSEMATVQGDLSKKVDASVLQSYSTTVEMNKAIAEGVTAYDATLSIGNDNLWSLDASTVVNEHGSSTRTALDKKIEYYRYVTNSFTSNISRIRNESMLPNNYIGQYMVGTKYTFSMKVRAIKPSNATFHVYVGDTSKPIAGKPLALTTEWQTITETFTLTGTSTAAPWHNMFCITPSQANGWAVGDWFEVKEVMLQRGTKATAFVKANATTINAIDANATAISGMKTEVSNIDGKVSSNSNAITQLKNDVVQVNKDLNTKASSQAVTDLKSQVDVMEGKVTSNTTAVTKLNNDVTKLQGDVSKMATSEAMQALDSRVTVTENTITSQQSSITKLQGDIATTNQNVSKKADAATVSAIDQRVTDAEGKISSQTTQITDIKNNLTVTNNNVADAELLARLVSQGRALRTDPTFKTAAANLIPYATVTGTSAARVARTADNPTNSSFQYLVRATTANGQGWLPNNPQLLSAPNKVYLVKQIVKMPVGLVLAPYGNPLGTGGYLKVFGNNKGTGKFDVYYSVIQCGPDAGVTLQGHFRPINSTDPAVPPPKPTADNPVDVIVASYEVWDVTDVADGIPKEWADKIEASSSAVESLNSKVSNLEGVTTSQQSKITSLEGRVTKTENDITTKADSSALQTLDSKVTTIGNKTDSNAADITTLKNRVTKTESDITTKADATAVTTLTNRVTQNEKDISSQSNAMTTLKNNISSAAEGIALNTTVQGWITQINTNKVAFVADNFAVGGQVFKLGDGKGSATNSDAVWIHGPDFIPVDPNRMYRIKARFRRITGAGSIYIGVAQKNTDKSQYVTTSNTLASTMSASNYLFSTNALTNGTWYEKELFLKGVAAGIAGGLSTIASPRTFANQASWFTPMFIANLNSGVGEVELDYITVEYADEYPIMDAQASATTTLSSKVDTVDGKVTSLTSSVTQLTGRVNTVEQGLATKADGSALQALDLKVTQQGKDMSVIASDVTKLDGRISNLSISTNNVLLNSGPERISSNPIATREYLMYERSPELKAFYNECIADGKGFTLSFEIKTPIAGRCTVYASNSSAHSWSDFTPDLVADTWTKVVIKKKPVLSTPNAAGSTLEFFGQQYGNGRIPTVRNVMLVKGDVEAAWQPSPRDTLASFEAQGTAIATLDTQTKALDGKITTVSNDVVTLTGRVTTAEGKIDANVNAISGLRTDLTVVDGKVDAQASNVTKLQSRVDANAGPGLAQDYAVVDFNSWHHHYNMANFPAEAEFWFNQPIEDGPVGPRGFYVPVGRASVFLYNKTPLPPKKYRVQFWAKKSSSAGGANYITIARMKAGEAPNVSNYSYVAINNAELPIDGTWRYIDKVVDLSGGLTVNGLYTNFRLGFSINNGTSAGEAWVQGFKITEVVDMKDTDGVASADAMSALTTRVTTAEGKIDTQANDIVQLKTSVAGKADASAVTSLTARVSTAEGKIESLTESNTTLTNRMTTAEGKITTNTTNIQTMTNKVTDIDGKVSNQATQINKVEADLTNMDLGGANLWSLQKTGVYTGGIITQPSPKIAISGNKITMTGKTANEVIGCAIPYTTGKPLAIRFKPIVGVNSPTVYYRNLNASGGQVDSQKTVTAVLKDGYYSVVIPASSFVAGTAITNLGFGGNLTTVVEVAEVTVQLGNKNTNWTDSYRDIPEVDLSEYAKASAVTSLQSQVNIIDGKVTSQATSIQQLQTTQGEHTAKLQVQGEAVDGMKASFFVKADVNGLVSGFGLYNDGNSSAFGVNADYFYIGKATGGKKPFIVTTSPQTIDGITYPAGTWIHSALIANATIGTAHIADAAITNAKIANLDASKITTGVLNAQRVRVGPTSTFDTGYDPSANLQAAKDYNDIYPIPGGGGKIFRLPAAGRLGTASTTATLVIKTGIGIAALMCMLDIQGSNYTASVGNAFSIELGFYAYMSGTPFVNMRAKVSGLNVSTIRLALDTDGKVVILITKATAWTYPQVAVNTATIMHSAVSDNLRNGWTVSFETDVSRFTNVTNVPIDAIETEQGAQNKANVVNAKVDEFSTDGILSSPEKKQVKTMWDEIAKEYPTYLANAGSVSVATSNYTSTYNTLNTYLTPLLANLNTNSTIVRTTFQASFANYYDERTKLIKAINDAIKAVSDNAKNVADSKSRTYITQPFTPYALGDIWKSGNSTFICTAARATGAFNAADWGKVGDVTSENTAANSNQLGGTPAATINNNITNATNTANTAKGAADAANNQVNEWKFTGTTEIDGGKIRADTVTATQINVQELSAISGNFGFIVTLKDPSKPLGTRTVMTGGLIDVYDDNNVLRFRAGFW